MKLTSYRVVKETHSKSAFDGEGSRLYGGRWNSKGISMVYTSESLALCYLEIFVHLPSYELLKNYIFIKVSFDSELILDAKIQTGWNERPASKVSQSIGDQWIEENQKPILRIPSIIVPEGNNYLLNFNHPDSDKIKIGEPTPLDFDPRLKK